MSKKILIAEDEPLICLLLKRTLLCFTDIGVSIFVANNGEEALKIAREEIPDLIILDIMMPKMNGFEVCEKIKDDPLLKHIYVIFMTAKGQNVDRKTGEKAGCNDYITKPVDPDELVKKVSTILDVKV